MSKKNSPKRLVFFKQTIAHLNNEQLDSARGGQLETTKLTITCPITQGESNFSGKDYTLDCTLTYCSWYLIGICLTR